jgi:hypothetical protein
MTIKQEKEGPEVDSPKSVGVEIGAAVKKFLEEHPDYKLKSENTSTYHSGYEWSDERDSKWIETISRPTVQKELVIEYSIQGRDLPFPTNEHSDGIEWNKKSESYGVFICGKGQEDPLLTNLLNELRVVINPKPVEMV